MSGAKVLLVDDDAVVRFSLQQVLQAHHFEVSTAADAAEALKQITSTNFDILISDLHMPGAADGLTVISAMRLANPFAVTFLLSAYPDLTAAAETILMQPHEILVKPINVGALVKIIEARLAAGPSMTRVIESAATILERLADDTVEEWLKRVEDEPTLTATVMSRELRIAYVPRILEDVIRRLRSAHPLERVQLQHLAAVEHGLLRLKQGYSASMMVRETRLLQASIFHALQRSPELEFNVALKDVMVIADEVVSQLGQSMEAMGPSEGTVNLMV